MRNPMRCAGPTPGIALSMALFLITCAPDAQAQATIGQTWEGSYSCLGSGEADLRLELTDSAGALGGTLHFEHPQGKGSYTVIGRVDAQGGFALVPQGWIERPEGFAALSLQGRMDSSGRRIEGTLAPCPQGRFSALPARAADAPPRALPAITPRTGGAFEGVWQGGVECTANRRGKTETYPLELNLAMDGTGVGGVGILRVFQTRNSNAGPTFDQVFALSGRADGNNLTLDRVLVLDRAGAPVTLRGIDATLGGDGRIAGKADLNGCQVLNLQRASALPPPVVPAAVQGLWSGASEGAEPTAVMVQFSATEAELTATWPANRPEAERDRLHLSLVPLDLGQGASLLVPVGMREATGIFSDEARPRVHSLIESRAFALRTQEGVLDLYGLRRPDDVQAALKDGEGSGKGAARKLTLTRPDTAQSGALAAGEAPPVTFQGGIGGLLAAAPSREGQCRVLADWLAPEARVIDLQRLAVDRVILALDRALADDRFAPVFGQPFLLTTQDGRRSVASFIRQSCTARPDHALVGFVGDFILMSDGQFASVSALLANRAETVVWLERTLTGLPALPVTPDSLKQLAALGQEARQVRTELLPDERKDLLSRLDRRAHEVTAGLLTAELRALEGSRLSDGRLGTVFRVLEDGRTLPPDLTGPLRAEAQRQANAILAEPIAQAAALAGTLEQSLEGLERGQAALAPIIVWRPQMEAAFGTVDAEGRLAPLHRRIDALRNDPAIQSEFAVILGAVEAQGDARGAILAAAAPYITEDELTRAPAFAGIVDKAVDRAELRQVTLTDRSTTVAADEPSVEEIADFALQRVRGLNEALAARDDSCMRGQFSNVLEGIECLYSPGVWTGQKGSGAALMAVEKIGCEENIPKVRYTCMFRQSIRINMPGGESLGPMIEQMTGGEVVDAMFLREAGGDWQVIWEVSND